MPQIGEGVKPTVLDMKDPDCPFDHELEEPPDVENKLVGSGTTLRSEMKQPKQTRLYAPMMESGVQSIKNPKDVSTHAFYKKKDCVAVTFKDNDGTEETEKYPVTCAAHHCIPAQESLQHSPLLTFMVKQGVPEDLKLGPYNKGSVWSDVGYDVNGLQNGVYLPGSYAVGGGRGGLGVWAPTDDGDDDGPDPDDEAPAPTSGKKKSSKRTIDGVRYQIKDSNPAWQYVKGAMDKAPGQFHDTHRDYSQGPVQTVLKEIFEEYNDRLDKIEDEDDEACGECAERAKTFAKLGHPTPYRLVERLDTVSSNLAGYLTGPLWVENIFTSTWVQKYMQGVLATRRKRKR
jgi:hypothetical protein